jgi:hypothetical protein
MFDYSRLPSVLPCDKLHIHFCKYILAIYFIKGFCINFNFSVKCIMLIFKHIVNSCIVIKYFKKSVDQNTKCHNPVSQISGISYFNTNHVSHSCIYNLLDILCNHLMFYYVYMPLRGPHFNYDAPYQIKLI